MICSSPSPHSIVQTQVAGCAGANGVEKRREARIKATSSEPVPDRPDHLTMDREARQPNNHLESIMGTAFASEYINGKTITVWCE
jgi:hypothetical protein